MPIYPNDKVAINVRDFLSNPSRVTRQVERLVGLGGTIADYAMAQGDANQGAVVYDQVTGEQLTPEREVEVIAPGSEFPEVVDVTTEEKLARVDTYGGKVEITRQAIRRNDVNEVQRKLTLLSNLVRKRVNAVTLHAVTTNPLINRADLSTDWADPTTDPIGDILVSLGIINDNELGYQADLALVNPLDAAEYFLGRKDVREQLPRENVARNPVLSADLGNIAGLEWIKNSSVPRGKLYVLQRGVTGSVRDEEGGIQSNSYYNNDRHVQILQSWRSIVPIITDPKSAVEISGFRPVAP